MSLGKVVLGLLSIFLIYLVTYVVGREIVFKFYPLIENIGSSAHWWDPFVPMSTAKLLYPNSYVLIIMGVFYGGVIGLVISFIEGIIEFYRDME